MTALYDLTNNFLVRLTMEILLNSIWQGIALAGLTFAFLRLTPRANAATRYGVWFAALLILVAIPLTGVLLAYADTKETLPVAASQQMAGPSSTASSASSSPQISDETILAGSQTHTRNDFTGEPAANPNPNLSESHAPVQLTASRNVVLLPTGVWLSIFFCGWLLVAGVRTGRVLASHSRLRELKRNSAPLIARHQSRLRQFLSAYPRARRVKLAGSSEISMPMAVGLRNPVIIFPLTLVGQLTEDEFDQILLHELAHIQRRDDWTNFVQKLIEAILFFHPAVLWIGRRLTLEREVACDDHVICVTKAGKQYAVCLTKLAELTVMPQRQQQGAGLAPGVLQSRKHIFSRVEFLLKKKHDINPRVSKAGLLLTLSTLSAAFLPCLLMSPVIALAARTADENTRTQTSAPANVDVVKTVALAADDTGQIVSATSATNVEANAGRQPSHDVRAAAVGNVTVSDVANSAATSSELRQRTAPAADAAQRENYVAAAVMEEVSRMSSSSDKTDALLEIIEREASLDAMPAGFFEAVATISSSLDKTRVLSALLRKNTGRSLFIKTLRATEGIESNSDKTELLIRASSICPDDAALSVYLNVVATLDSSFDQQRALFALLKRPALSRAILLRARSLALNNIADPQSRQLVLDRIEARLSE